MLPEALVYLVYFMPPALLELDQYHLLIHPLVSSNKEHENNLSKLVPQVTTTSPVRAQQHTQVKAIFTTHTVAALQLFLYNGAL